MSYIYLLEQAAGSLQVNSSEIPQFALWKVTNTAKASSCSASATESSQNSPFGMTLGPLTANHGATKSTRSAADSPARTSAFPEKERDLPENGLGCGANSTAWFAKWNPDTCSWKTPQCSLAGGSEEFSGTWPKQGTMRNGLCWEPTMSEAFKHENEYGFSLLKKMGLTRMIPTPCASDATRGPGKVYNPSSKRQSDRVLTTFCTRTSPPLKGGKPNPPWVEWLMGWPMGWTDLEPLATAKFLQWLHMHGDTFRKRANAQNSVQSSNSK